MFRERHYQRPTYWAAVGSLACSVSFSLKVHACPHGACPHVHSLRRSSRMRSWDQDIQRQTSPTERAIAVTSPRPLGRLASAMINFMRSVT